MLTIILDKMILNATKRTIRHRQLLLPAHSQFCTSTETTPKTITELFKESMRKVAEEKQLQKSSPKTPKSEPKRKEYGIKSAPGYVPRFKYNGYLKNCTWVRFTDEMLEKRKAGPSEEQINYKHRDKAKFCILMAFAGGKYNGMQNVGPEIGTIELILFEAMIKNRWLLPEHRNSMYSVDYCRASRTDAGVSAARMYCSAILPKEVSIEALNNDLPSDIRVFALKRATPKFSSRMNCSARTYSYTLPSIAFSRYDERTSLQNYRIPSERLQLASQVLSIYKGRKNFHNYTLGKMHFDRSANRTMMAIDVSEPFVEGDIEFCRVTIKGESFMLHQIRKMIGTSLGVIRGLITEDFMQSTFNNDRLYLPKAPGLGLMLERLHFDQYAKKHPNHDPLTFDEYDEAIDQFRREVIHPVIIETEMREHTMMEWLDLLCCHTFDKVSREEEMDHMLGRYVDDERPYMEWGESPEFLEKLKNLEKDEK